MFPRKMANGTGLPGSGTILLVEDDEMVFKMVADMLKEGVQFIQKPFSMSIPAAKVNTLIKAN